MSTEPQYPDTFPDPRPAREGSAAPLVEANVESRADIEEDRRRQRELDDAELGGEA